MARIALFCPPAPGHLNPAATLGRALLAKGHEVTLYGIADVAMKAAAAGLTFRVLAPDEYPVGSLQKTTSTLGRLTGLPALRFTVESACRLADMISRFAPDAIRSTGADLLIVDQNEPAAGTVADHLRLPFINILNLPINFDPTVPPPFTPWPCNPGIAASLRNRAAYAIFNRILGPVTKIVNRYRAAWNLLPLRTPDDSFSTLGQICQMNAAFDFPRRRNPRQITYTGPFFDDAAPLVPFPYERLDGKPLIYASMGTLQNRDPKIFRYIAEACVSLRAQLVLSLGGGDPVTTHASLPGNPIVVDYAPQTALLSRASLAITHGGLNSVQEALRFGVPMVALPVTNDQPAVGARLVRAGAGEVIPITRVNASSLHHAIHRVLNNPEYRKAAGRMRDLTLVSGGVARAAKIIDAALAERTARGVSAVLP